VRASCLSLAGRTQHTLGDLSAADASLRTAVAIAPPEARTMAQVWLAAVCTHRGADEEAVDLSSRALLGIALVTHPFAPAHALFARAQALGHRGEVVAALQTLDDLDDLVAREGDQLRRFGPVSNNCRAWILRNVGRLDEARVLNGAAASLPVDDPPYAEPRFAGLLDLVDHELASGDVVAAGHRLEGVVDIEQWYGSMHWRHKMRYRLLRGRVALELGDREAAGPMAVEIAHDCRTRGVRRYELFACVLAGRAGVAGAQSTLAAALAELERLAGLEVWWLTAQVASEVDELLWPQARRRLEVLAGRAGAHAPELRTYAVQRFPSLTR
jgi:hypothetical protein